MAKEKSAQPAEEESKNLLEDFILFIKGFGVIGLAIGVIIGQATNGLVQSIAMDIISPLISLLFQADRLSEVMLGPVRIGAFFGELIDFFLILFVIWLIVRLFIARFLTQAEKEKIGIK